MSGFCYIVGAGDFFEEKPFALGREDFLIAADAGFSHLIPPQKPDLLIGDFDSLEEPGFAGEKIRLPRRKDHTDLLEACCEGMRRGYRKFLIFGATGGRISHTVANLQCLSYLKQNGCRGWIFDEKSVLSVIANETVRFPKEFRGYFSAFSLSDRSIVTERGFSYSVENAALENTYPLGVSNEFTGQASEICVSEGQVLIVYERANLKNPARAL